MILLGDTLGDPNISDDMKHLSTVLKIGFLNSDVSVQSFIFICVVHKSIQLFSSIYSLVVSLVCRLIS